MNDKMIYGLSGPDGRIRYIGVSSNDLRYVTQHHRSAAKAQRNESPVNLWILEIGLQKFQGEVLEYVSADDAKDRVAYWVDYQRANGEEMLNLTKEEHSERVKTALAKPGVMERAIANRPKTYTRRDDWVSQKGQTGRHITDEHKAAVSRAHKGKTLSPETRAKIAERAKGHKRNLNRVQSPETRAKMSATKHERGHLAAGTKRDTCPWCNGMTFDQVVATLT